MAGLSASGLAYYSDKSQMVTHSPFSNSDRNSRPFPTRITPSCLIITLFHLRICYKKLSLLQLSNIPTALNGSTPAWQSCTEQSISCYTLADNENFTLLEGEIFSGGMSQFSDGISFLLEANPKTNQTPKA